MTAPRPADERIALWLEEEAEGVLPDRVLEATFDRTRGTRQARGSAWRSFPMTRPLPQIAVGAAVIVLFVGLVSLRPAPSGNGGALPTTSPSASVSPSPRATPTASPIDTSDWVAYTSTQYGFSISHPTGWEERPASRAWTFEADGGAFDPTSPARDSFSIEPAPGLGVLVSAWSVATPGEKLESQADLEAWIEQYCQQTDTLPCAGIHDRAVTLCVERRDCHLGILVPFRDEVQAFWPTVVDEPGVTIVAVWRPDSDPSVAGYGGSVNLLMAFLSTMYGGGNSGVYPAPSSSL
jgi:hypothetical protein